MTHKERRILMIKTDVKDVDIAGICDVSPTMVYLVRKGISRSFPVETAMADACYVPLLEMSPEPSSSRNSAA